MLSKLREQLKEELRKREGTVNMEEFLPFLNERDSVGRVIHPTKKLAIIEPEEILQSLKMTTQQFFSRKKFKKDLRRFYLLKRSLNPKEMDYDLEVSRCEQLITKITTDASESSLNSQLFYDVDRRTNQRLEKLRNTLTKQNQRKNRNSSHQKTHSKRKESDLNRSMIRPVKTEIFREVDKNAGTNQSQFMANWTRCSVPYRQHVHEEVRKPERSNYATYVHKIFRGRELYCKEPKRSYRGSQP